MKSINSFTDLFHSILPMLVLCSAIMAVSCEKDANSIDGSSFDISEYSAVITSSPALWDGRQISQDPTISVLINGPERQSWAVYVQCRFDYENTAWTGEKCDVWLDGLAGTLDPSFREIMATVKIYHAKTKQVLLVKRGIPVRLEGDFD